MIGYGIPLITVPADAVVVDVDDASGVIVRSYRCFSSGYLAKETVLHLYPSLEACYDRTLKWNDIYLNNRAKQIQRRWRQHPSREIDDDTLLEDNEWDTCECCRAVVKVTFGLTCDGYSIANDDVTGEMCCRACLDKYAEERE